MRESSIKVVEGLDENACKNLIELMNSIKIVQDYLNDQVVQDLSKLASPIFKILNAISSTDLIDVFERALQDPDLDKALLNPPKVGLMGFLKALSEEDVQRGMGITIALLRTIGKASTTLVKSDNRTTS